MQPNKPTAKDVRSKLYFLLIRKPRNPTCIKTTVQLNGIYAGEAYNMGSFGG